MINDLQWSMVFNYHSILLHRDYYWLIMDYNHDFRLQLFDFLLQWSFNMGTTMDHSIHWYYCCGCWLGDPSGHLENIWTFSDFENFGFWDFNFWNFILDFLLQWSFMGTTVLWIIQYIDTTAAAVDSVIPLGT